MLGTPFYDPNKSYEENFNEGPFSVFADDKVVNQEGEPKFEIFGKKVFLPFGIPAGPLLNGKFIKAALDKGFDIPMHKTVRTRKRKSNPWPNVLAVKVEGDLTFEKAKSRLVANRDFQEPLSITNSFGNPSADPDVWQKDLADCVAYAKNGQVVTASLEGTQWPATTFEDSVKDWALGARLLKETGITAIEANLSCPNEGITDLLCFDTVRVRIVVEAIKNEIGNMPLIMKTAYFKEQNDLEHLISSVGKVIDGIASINTIPVQIVDEQGNQALPGEGRLRSGVCGAAIKWAGLDMVKRLKSLRESMDLRYTIIGVGGVMHADDYFEYRHAGADVVMSATGAMWNPNLAKEIKSAV